MTIVRAASLRETLGLRDTPPNGTAWHSLIRGGLPYRSLTVTAKTLGLKEKTFGALLEIPARTLAARKRAKRLAAAESDVLYAIARAYVRLASFKEIEASRAWLLTPAEELKGLKPIELLHTRLGTEYVMNVIDRERAAVVPKVEVKPADSDETEEDEESDEA